jgi:hypothetical protein
MPTIQKINNKNFWLNAEGIPVEVKRIQTEEKKRERVVNKTIKQALKASEILTRFHEDAVRLVDNYLQEVAEQYGEAWQGATTLYNFNQTQKIDVKISKTIDFNEHFNTAEKKIFKYIETITTDLNSDVASIVRLAFSRNRAGVIDPKKILDLKRLKIKDKDWVEAMELIDKSIFVKSTKRYLNFWIREDKDWVSIPLNFSKMV